MYLIGTANTSSQVVLTGGDINIGNVYRRFCKRVNCLPMFSADANGITINHKGQYHITATFVLTGTTTGNATIQALVNGQEIPYAYATETIGTATTEFHTLVIDFFTLVDNDCVLNCTSTTPNVISFDNIGVGITLTNVVVNVEKVL